MAMRPPAKSGKVGMAVMLLGVIMVSGLVGFFAANFTSAKITIPVGITTVTYTLGQRQPTTQTTTSQQASSTTPIITPTTQITYATSGTTDIVQPQQGTLVFRDVKFRTATADTSASSGVITVPKGTTVEVWVKLEAIGGTATGTIDVIIKKDLVLTYDYYLVYENGQPKWSAKIPDQPAMSKEVTVLQGSEDWVFIGVFIPDETTTLGLRQYFVKVLMNGQLVYDPQDPNNRVHLLVS